MIFLREIEFIVMCVIYPVTRATLRERRVPVSRFQSDMSVKCVYGMKDSDSVTYEVQFDGQLSALVSPVYLITRSTRPDLSALVLSRDRKSSRAADDY